MGITNYPNGLSSMGSPITSGSYITTGNIFYVDSVTGSNDYTGLSPDRAVSTIDKAVTLCTSGLCDTIFVMPNHSESIGSSTGCRITKSGATIIGLGRGENRPTLTFDTAITADISISAHSVWIENLLLKSGIDALTHIICVDASQASLVNLEYKQIGAYEAAKVIDLTSSAKGSLVDGLIIREDVDADGTQMDAAIWMTDGQGIEIKNCFLMIASSGGTITSTSGTAGDNCQPCWVHHNYIENTSSDACVQWTSLAKTWGVVVSDNMFKVVTAGADPLTTASGAGTTSVWGFNNQIVNVDGEKGCLEVLSIAVS